MEKVSTATVREVTPGSIILTFVIGWFIIPLLLCSCVVTGGGKQMGPITESDIRSTIEALSEKHGEAHGKRIEDGVRQVAQLWRETDGTREEWRAFCLENFLCN